MNPKDPRLIPVPFPLFQGLIVLGEAAPPDPAVDDASRAVSAEGKLEPGAERLVSASSRVMLGAGCSIILEPGGMLKPQGSAGIPAGLHVAMAPLLVLPPPGLFWG